MKIKCTCKHDGQDALHGAQTRIANTTAKRNEKEVAVRCTVCKTLHNVQLSKVK